MIDLRQLQTNNAVGCDLFSGCSICQEVAASIVGIVCVTLHPSPMSSVWRKQFYVPETSFTERS